MIDSLKRIANKSLLEQRLDRYFKQIVEHPNTWVRIEVYRGKDSPQHKIQKEKEYLITRLMTGLKLVGLNP